MIRSMTGFGDASDVVDGVRYAVEIRSVNSKFLKAVLRIPDRLGVLEPWIEARLRERLQRGTVTVTISVRESDELAAHTINPVVLKSYTEQISKVSGIKPSLVDATALVHLPGVLQPPQDEESLVLRARKALDGLLNEALDHLVSMRKREGESLRADLLSHHDSIASNLDEIAEVAPGVSAAYEKRLLERLEKMLAAFDIKAEPADVIREVAVYAEKSDIAEEIVRLREHLRHLSDLLNADDPRPIGRTLDFLTQELLREANTIASKSPDAQISRLVVEVKGSIDRIKEQVQNAE